MLEVKLRRVLTIADDDQDAPCTLCALPMSGEELGMVQAVAIADNEIIGAICR